MEHLGTFAPAFRELWVAWVAWVVWIPHRPERGCLLSAFRVNPKKRASHLGVQSEQTDMLTLCQSSLKKSACTFRGPFGKGSCNSFAKRRQALEDTQLGVLLEALGIS